MKHLLLLCVFAILVSSCSNSSSNTKTITIAGSSTVLPIISNAAELYKETHPDIKIIVNAGGSGVGVNQVGSQKVNIGMISRDITSKEKGLYPSILFKTQAIGKDAVIPAISSEIYDAGITTLTLEQIAKIYKGEITNWSALQGPNKDILVIDKEKSRGTRHVFMATVMNNKEADAPGADLVLGSNNEEQTALVQSDAAIGMLSMAWLNNDVKGTSIQTPNGEPVAPTLSNIIEGKFPITRDLTIVTNGNPTGEVKNFIDFLLSPQGQSIVTDNGYVSIK
ncbi:phosphate ABC transporter substrate-binding protein [Dokdonia sp.]|uniref:phosphate ABC transporter substrate-binding protein n=1 Tax=Dokdonia sp. TaxID=2024995 RepID=UPI003263FB89